ncbi:MAG: zinc ribbon domain-containing protein [Chloroflexi bacterium]|nr:zinc ribbon domain-containing protein [Chloroflexota bacterium]
MRKWLILLALVVLLTPSPAQAQEGGTVTLDTLSVMLWSEYDQPSMLVIYNFTVTEDTTVPGTVDLRFPADANITAVAYQSGGELLLAQYKSLAVEDGNWQAIQIFLTERTTYHIEYYQPLKRSGEKRSFTYQWTGDYAVNAFDIEVQVPADSKGAKTTPVIPLMQSQGSLSGGARMSSLAQGQTYQLQLEYSRSSEIPLATPVSQQVEPLSPVNEDTDGRATLENLPMVLGGFGVALMIAALVYFFRGQSASARSAKPRRRSQRQEESSAPAYCPECGTRSQPGDRFCRVCGSKLR